MIANVAFMRSESVSSKKLKFSELRMESECARDRKAEKVLTVVACLSAAFIVAEFVGGCIAHSLAIMTDAGHILSDLLSFIISIVAIRFSRHPANSRLSFGYERAEILGATVSIVIIWIITTVLVMLAANRIVEKDLDVDADTMLITASAGVVFNLIMGAVLHFGHAGHSHHGVSRKHTHRSSTQMELAPKISVVSTVTMNSVASEAPSKESSSEKVNVNLRAAFIHVLGDLIQSVGVLVAAVIIKTTGWTLADPICTFLFSVIVLVTSITVLRDIFYVLMEATPREIDYPSLRNELVSLSGVRAAHNLHVWSLNMDKIALSVHLAIDDPTEAVEIIREATNLVRTKYGVALPTVQVEPYIKTRNTCFMNSTSVNY